MACGGGVVLMACENDLPATNSAIARRSVPVRPLAIESMGPLSRAESTRSGVIALNVSRFGARSVPAS
jgi:hypothetical protein